MRRLFVPVITAALILGVAPSPSFGLGIGEVRPHHRDDDHYRCMYRCEERGESFRPPPRPRPPAQDRPRKGEAVAAQRHFFPPIYCLPIGELPLYRHGGWGHDWCYWQSWHPRPGGYRPCWYRPCRPHRPWNDYDRYDRYRDRDDDRGYDAHRQHPRGRDF